MGILSFFKDVAIFSVACFLIWIGLSLYIHWGHDYSYKHSAEYAASIFSAIIFFSGMILIFHLVNHKKVDSEGNPKKVGFLAKGLSFITASILAGVVVWGVMKYEVEASSEHSWKTGLGSCLSLIFLSAVIFIAMKFIFP